MNHIYRVVFNHALGVMQAIAETGRTRTDNVCRKVRSDTCASLPLTRRPDSLFRKQRIAQIVALATTLFAQGHAYAGSSPDIEISSDSTTSQTLSANGSVTVDSNVTLNVSDGSNAIGVKGTGTITNNGTIEETGSGSDAGRAIRDKSDPLTLTVDNYGLIEAKDDDAIQMQYSDNSVKLSNYGQIISDNISAGGAQAIDFNAITTGINSVYNAPGALIEAYEADAVRPGVNGTIDNAGRIYSYNAAATIGDSSDGIDAQSNTGIAITNESTGIVEGARHGITGGNTDTGTSGAFTLSVINAAGGTIQGDDGSGMNIDGFNANEIVTVVNNGTIQGNGLTGDGDGVDVDGIVNLTNTGTIVSLHANNDTSEGVTVGGGTIVNSGTIAGENSATNSIDNSANTGTGRGITLAGIDKDPTTKASIPTEGIYADTSVDNSGLIVGQTAGAIAVTGAANAFTVSITNEADGTLEGGGSDAVVFTGGNDATVINYGTIKADGSGKAIDLGSGDSAVQILGGAASVTGDMDGGTGQSTLTMTPGTGNAFTYGGAISDFASVKVGAGTVMLNGVNTYTGATTIDAGGTLALKGTGSIAASSGVTANGALDISGTTSGTSIASLSGSGTVNLGGNTLTLTNASGTFSGSISGTGGLTIVSGTQTLTGVSSYLGTTLIETGATLMLSNAGDIILANVVNDGTLEVEGTLGNLSGTGTVTVGSTGVTLSGGSFGGTLSGSGPITVTGNETLSGASTYTGATSITSGTTLALTGSGSIARSSGVADNGAFDISGTTAGASIASLSGSGAVALGSRTLTLSNAADTFNGVIDGAGGVAVNGGKETLTAANTYTGGTTIGTSATLALTGAGSIAQSSGVTANGTLDLSATTSGATVQNLSGTGTVNLGAQKLTLANANGTFGGAFAGSGALVKQGAGSLILNGNSSAFTGTTEVASGLLEVGDQNNTGAVLGGSATVDADGTLRGHGTVSGDVTNDGTVEPGGSIGTLTISSNYAQAPGATLAIEVSPTAASQLVVGGTATLNGVLSIAYDPGTYTARTYTLVSAAGGVNGTFSSVTSSGTSNLGTLASSVAYGSNDVELVLSGTNSTSPVVVAPTGTSIYTAAGTSAILAAQAQSAALLGRLGNDSTAGVANPAGWITATGIETRVGGTNGAPGFQADRYGFLAGLEQRLGAYTAGFAVGYDHTDIDESDTGDSGTTDTLRTALYGGRALGPVNLGATLGLGLDFLSQKRPFGSIGTAEGDHMGEEFNVGGQASLPMTFGSFTVTPRVGLRYAYFHANGFGEDGAAGQDLAVGTDNVRSLQPYVGVTLDRAFGDAFRPVNAQLRVGYAHELLDANRAVSVAASDGTLFTAPGTSLPRGYFTAGAGVTLHPKKNLSVSLSYDALINTTHASAQQGEVRVGYQF